MTLDSYQVERDRIGGTMYISSYELSKYLGMLLSDVMIIGT